VKRLNVLVERDGGVVIPLEIHEFELPVLESIHVGVTVVDEKPGQDIDPDTAYGMLTSNYGDEAVTKVFPTAHALARQFAPKAPEKKAAKG
jgi:hypothetical protein